MALDARPLADAVDVYPGMFELAEIDIPPGRTNFSIAHVILPLLRRRAGRDHSPALLRGPETRLQHRRQRLFGSDLGCQLGSFDVVDEPDADALL